MLLHYIRNKNKVKVCTKLESNKGLHLYHKKSFSALNDNLGEQAPACFYSPDVQTDTIFMQRTWVNWIKRNAPVTQHSHTGFLHVRLMVGAS